MKDKGRQFLSDLKLYSDYLKWRPSENGGRYETWDEACDDVMHTHLMKYGKAKLKPIKDYVSKATQLYKDRAILASQRNLQYRGDQILEHNMRIYNCSFTYANAPDLFEKTMYVLLCGTGLGVHLGTPFIKHMPDLVARGSDTETYVVEDSIQGWGKAVGVLISSFMSEENAPYPEYSQKNIRFDYTQIRPRGAHISGGFKAPGPDGLKQSLERIETLLSNNIGEFKSIAVYDTLMHISDAVLSGGVRRSAMNVLFFEDDEDMINAKTGNWRTTHEHRARSNNSVVLMRDEVTKQRLTELITLNQGESDLGFVFAEDFKSGFNPCFEISFGHWDEWQNKNTSCFQQCNLNEVNAAHPEMRNKDGSLNEEFFYECCEAAAVLGTLQAGYTDFPYMNEETERIVAGEALLGVSITGWMANPNLLQSSDVLERGAEIVKATNEKVASALGINPAARTTCVKPSGNSSVVLGCPSGIHPEHAKSYFRVMQLNKESDSALWLKENMPCVLEDSVYSATNVDYAVYVPIRNDDSVIVKDEMKGVTHLEHVKNVQKHWVIPGKTKERCYTDKIDHNVSVTVILDDIEKVASYLMDNIAYFTAVSFISEFGDKDYPQAPNTSVKSLQEIIEAYGEGALLASGLIVDGLHYFGDLWQACSFLINKERPLEGTKDQVLLKKDWLRRARKFSRNFFKRDLEKTIYCLKDVHLFHKWQKINREFKEVNFTEVLDKPQFRNIEDYASIACAGGACEII